MYRNAVRHMTESSLQALQHAGRQVADVDRVVSYQASLRIIQAVAARLAVPKDRLVSNIEGVGNTTLIWPQITLPADYRR